MQIVIDIDDKLYKEYVCVQLARGNGKTIVYNLLKAIKKGKPLPEHHGRLIDADALYELSRLCHTEEDGTACVEWREINDAPTIIEESDSE